MRIVSRWIRASPATRAPVILMGCAACVALIFGLLNRPPFAMGFTDPGAHTSPTLSPTPQSGKALSRHSEASLHISVESSVSGVQYRCSAEGLPANARTLTVWKTVDSEGSLINTLHSSILSAGRVDPRHDTICQILVDEGVFYQLLERRLHIPRTPGRSQLPQTDAPAFLDKRSTLEVITTAGQKVATCAFGDGVIANARTEWTMDGLALADAHSSVLLLDPGWSGQLACRYAVLAWSGSVMVQADRVLGVPELLYPARGRRAQFFPVWLPEPGAELKCSVQLVDSDTGPEGPEKTKAGTLPQWHCATWSHSSLPDLGLVFAHSAAENAANRKAELITTARSKSGSSSFSTRILSESAPARRFRHLNDVNVVPGDVQGTLVCDPGLPRLERDQAVQPRLASSHVPDSVSYVWTDGDGAVLQRSGSASLVLKDLPQSIDIIQCFAWSASGESVIAGQSKPFRLGNKLQPFNNQTWFLWNGGSASLEVILKVPIRERQAPSTLKMTCELLIGADQATDQNFCLKAARRLPRNTLKGPFQGFLSSSGQSALYAVELRLSGEQLRQFWHTASGVSTQDRFAPLNLRFLMRTSKPVDLAGEQTITLLRSNHAPEISRIAAKSDGEHILCSAEIRDPDRDHFTLEWTSPQSPGKKVTISTSDLLQRHQKMGQELGFSAAMPLPKTEADPERLMRNENGHVSKASHHDAEDFAGKAATRALCRLTVSDGVLVATSLASGQSAQKRQQPAHQLATAQQIPAQGTNPLPFPTHARQAHQKLAYAHLTGATYGPQAISFGDDQTFQKITSCTGLQFEGAACPQLRLENGRLVVQVNDALFHGLYAVWLVGQKGSRTLAIIDIINGGLAGPLESARGQRSSCTALLQAARRGQLHGAWIDLATVPQARRRSALSQGPLSHDREGRSLATLHDPLSFKARNLWGLASPFRPDWARAQLNRFQADLEGPLRSSQEESPEPIHCRVRFPEPSDLNERQNEEETQSQRIKASSVQSDHTLLVANLEAPIDTRGLLSDLLIRERNPELPPLLQVKSAQLCSPEHCVSAKDRLQLPVRPEDLPANPTLLFKATFETITGSKSEYSARISPIAVRPTNVSPFVAQLYTKEKQSSRVECSLAQALHNDKSAETTEQANSGEELEFRFLSLERVVHTQLTTARTAEAPEDPASPYRIDSCEVFKNGQKVARSALVPSVSSQFNCFATVENGWRSRVACTFSGRGAWEKLSFNNVQVNLGNLSESPLQFEAYWTNASGETEKGFVHLFERSRTATPTPIQGASHSETESGEDPTSGSTGASGLKARAVKASAAAPLRVFSSPQNLAQWVSRNLAERLNAAQNVDAAEQEKRGNAAKPNAPQQFGIECAAPAPDKEQCTLIARMIESINGTAAVNTPRVQFGERSLESPYLLLYVWAYGEEDEEAPLYLGVSPLPQRLSKE